MFSKNNACRGHDNHSGESVNPASEAVMTEDKGDLGTPSIRGQRWEASCVEVEHPSKFIKGIIIALPASITLWAGMILGLKAIF